MQKKEGVKTSSTARRINREFVGRQFSSYFWMDIVVALMALVCWWIPVEVNVFGFLIDRKSVV